MKLRSRPSRARGLKLKNGRHCSLHNLVSRPSRARGLKLLSVVLLYTSNDVAPFPGAWIETYDRV